MVREVSFQHSRRQAGQASAYRVNIHERVNDFYMQGMLERGGVSAGVVVDWHIPRTATKVSKTHLTVLGDGGTK